MKMREQPGTPKGTLADRLNEAAEDGSDPDISQRELASAFKAARDAHEPDEVKSVFDAFVRWAGSPEERGGRSDQEILETAMDNFDVMAAVIDAEGSLEDMSRAIDSDPATTTVEPGSMRAFVRDAISYVPARGSRN